MLSFARDAVQARRARVRARRERASVGSPAEAVAFGEVVILSVPWSVIPEALAQAGDLAGTVVIDTTNQFGSGPMPAAGQTAASFNAERMPGARYVKSFNTLDLRLPGRRWPARDGDERVVQWICGDDARRQAAGRRADRGHGLRAGRPRRHGPPAR